MTVSYISIKRARELALEYHWETKWTNGKKETLQQTDKLGRPYVMHLDETELGLRVFGADSELRACAYLHDIVEDTTMTFATLKEEGASDRQILAVEAVTKRTSEPQTAYLDRIIAGGTDAMMLKLADLFSNTRPDKMAQLPEYTRNRLRKKYAPSMARLMQELGFLVDSTQFHAIPQGSTNAASFTWGEHQPSWFFGGDQMKVGKGDSAKIKTVKKKEVLPNDRYRIIFDTGEYVEVHKDTKLMGRMVKTWDQSPLGGSTSTATTSSTTWTGSSSVGNVGGTRPATSIPQANYDPEDPWDIPLGWNGMAVYGD